MENLSSQKKEFKNILKKRGMMSYEMGKEISDSWSRCITEGLNPFEDPKQSVVSSIELKEIKEKNESLRKIVLPELELLYSQIAGTNFMVAYSDENGLVLDTIYDKTCLQTDVGKTVIPGSIWAEKVCGTNGLGLSVELKKPTIVSGKEHFFIAHENISCFASPIINYDGKTIGIIDASTDYMSREQHTLALVKLATRSIETKLFIKKFENELIISFHPRQEYLTTTSVGMLAINGDGLIVGANNNAKIMLNGLVDLKNEDFSKGILNINILHTSASIIVQENADSDVQKDILNFFDKLVPMDNRYIHKMEGKDDMPAHLKTILTSTNLCLSIKNSNLVLGTWQGLSLIHI